MRIGLATRCRGAVPSSSSSIIRSRSPGSTRPAARRSPGRWSPPRASSTATNSRAGSTIRRTCRSKSARRSTPGWSNARRWGVGIASVEEIDTINIYWARMLAMTRAVEALGLEPAWVLVDGNATPRWQRPSKAIVDGDAKCRSIAAASIIAKVTRDRIMADHAARLSRLRLGAESRLSDARSSARAATSSGRRRCTAAASAWCAKSRLEAPNPSSSSRNRAGESFAPHHHRLSPVDSPDSTSCAERVGLVPF